MSNELTAQDGIPDAQKHELAVTAERRELAERNAIIKAIADPDTPADRLEMLLKFRESERGEAVRREKEGARRSYYAAMSQAQQAMKPIQAKLKNTQTKSLYADFHAVDDEIRAAYTEAGLSVSAGSEKSELGNDYMYVFIDVMHEGGHAERYGDDFPIDNKGMQGSVNKTLIHGRQSTKTYARRYLLMDVFNLAIAKLDTDGNSPVKTITDEQVKELDALIRSIHPDEDALNRTLKFAACATLPEMQANMFARAKAELVKLYHKYDGVNES